MFPKIMGYSKVRIFCCFVTVLKWTLWTSCILSTRSSKDYWNNIFFLRVTVCAMACYVDRQCLNRWLKCFHGDSVNSQKSEKVSPLVDWSIYVIFLLWDMTWKKTTSNFVCVGNYAPLMTPCWPFIHKMLFLLIRQRRCCYWIRRLRLRKCMTGD